MPRSGTTDGGYGREAIKPGQNARGYLIYLVQLLENHGVILPQQVVDLALQMISVGY